MLDYLGQELYIDDDVTFVQHTNASSIFLKGRVIGFTPQMVKLQQLNSDGSVRREILKTPVFIIKVNRPIDRIEQNNTIVDLFKLLSTIRDKCDSRDFSFFRATSGAGGCDMYQGSPPFIRAYDGVVNPHQVTIERALKGN